MQRTFRVEWCADEADRGPRSAPVVANDALEAKDLPQARAVRRDRDEFWNAYDFPEWAR